MKTKNGKKPSGYNRISYETGNTSGPPLPPGSSANSRIQGKRGLKRRGRSAARSGKRQRGKAERLITGGILAASLSIVVSLSVYFRPFLSETVFPAVRTFCFGAADAISDTVNSLLGRSGEEEKASETFLAQESSAAPKPQNQEEMAYMDRSSQMGDISDMSAEPVYPTQEDAIYSCMLDTPLGPLVYYNQGDVRWKEYLYGGFDRLAKYGCGPVCVSMLINSFTSTAVSPVEMADWSAENGYYARQSGSYHGLIPGSLSAFGLQVDSVTERTAENVRSLLENDHVLVALMGRGALTQNGHFIIIAQLSPSGNVYIADPASYENSTKEWDLDLLMNELKKSYDSGGPLWAVSLKEVSNG